MRNRFDYYKQIESPEMYLCNPDQKFLCALLGEQRILTLRFNDLSELSFTVPKIEGTENSYNLIEAKRLIYVDNIGWFQIDSANEESNGDRCYKSVIAKSHQAIFMDRGFVLEERLYMFYNPNDDDDSEYDSKNQKAIPSVVGQLKQQLGIKTALGVGDVEPNVDYKDWTLIYIDPVLIFRSKSDGGDAMYESADSNNVCRSFKANNDLTGYDFMINEVEKAFEVIFEFDFLHHAIKVKTLGEITKPTDIYLSSENVVNTLNIKEKSEDIVTVLDCKGGDLDITTVNPMGTNYIVDFSYFKKTKNECGVEYPWMSKELIETLDAWELEYNKWKLDDEQRVDHQKGYRTLVVELQSLLAEKTTYDADLQYANLKITDMMAARDQYIDKIDRELEGSGYVTAESVSVGTNSLLPRSRFYTTKFQDDVQLTGHLDSPKFTKIVDQEDDQHNALKFHYEFSFADEGVTGTPKSLIESFVGSDDKEENATPVPLYFMDEDNRSYCKLTVESEVGIVKDANGFVAGDGVAEVRGTSFSVKAITGGCEITLPDGRKITTSQSNSYFLYNGTRYRALQSADGIVSIYCFFISGFERYTTYTETVGNGGWISLWEKHINEDINGPRAELQEKIDAINKELEYISDKCNIQKFVQRESQELYDELTNYWIEGSYSNENFTAYDSTTMEERIDLARKLLDAAKIDLNRSAQPQYEISVDAINFIKIWEFKKFTDELELGRTVTVEKADGLLFHMALMTMEYNLDSSENFSLTFSNASRPNETSMTFADLIKESSSISRTVSANWSNLTEYAKNKEGIYDLIMDPLDRTLRAAKDNMVNQEFIVDSTGILGRKWKDDSKSAFEDEQIRIINNTILFTQDNWETASLALGKIYFGDNEDSAYGLVADVLIGNLMFGSKMKIVNQGGNITFDENGITVQDAKGVEHFKVTPEGDVSILNYATSSDLNGVTETLRGEIKASAGGIESTFTETLKNYSTTQQMQSAISQSAKDIEASVKETITTSLNGYSTTTEMEAAIKLVSDSLTAYAKKIDGGETTAFGYTLNDTQFLVWNGNQDNPVLLCNADGLQITGNATFSGKIEASEGNIGGLLIGSNGLSSEWFSVGADGVLVAESIRVNDRFQADNMQISRISGKYTDSPYLDFEQAGAIPQYVSVNCNYVVTDYGNTNIFGWKPGSATVTVSTNVSIISSRIFDITLYYSNSVMSESVTQYVTIPAGGTFSSIDIPYMKKTPFGDSMLLSRVDWKPKGYQENTRVNELSIGCGGTLLPTSSGVYSLGDIEHYWKGIYQVGGGEGSDRKIKTDIKDLSESCAMKLICGLRPRTYKFNMFKTPRMRAGFIAQEVEDTLGSIGLTTEDWALVSKTKPNEPDSANNFYALDYKGLIAPIVSVIQTLISEVNDLRKKVCGYTLNDTE